MKVEIGSIVKMNKPENMNDYVNGDTGSYWLGPMDDYAEREVTVSRVDEESQTFHIEEDGEFWSYPIAAIESISDPATYFTDATYTMKI